MQRKAFSPVSLLATLVAGIGLVIAFMPIGNATQTEPQERPPIASHGSAQLLRLAGTPAACKWNYDQCMKGCNGAQQCSNQCMANYTACLK